MARSTQRKVAIRRADCSPIRRCTLAVAALGVIACFTHMASAAPLDEMAIDRWEKLRETERYQMQIAERVYREKNWKAAASEYEKYITLYEQSDAASYAQLKWSLCQVELRQLNTAISDGFQSVLDYWPDSPDAVAAAYYIGRTYKEMGEIKPALTAYRRVLEQYPKHLAAVYATVDMVDIAQVQKDDDACIELWKRLAFETERNRETSRYCSEASQRLAGHQFARGNFTGGIEALETTYAPEQIPGAIVQFARTPISNLTADDKTRTTGERLADRAVAYLRETMPTAAETDDEQAIVQKYWFAIADVHAAARRNEKVLETYRQMESTVGVDDATLSRLAGWLKSQKEFDEARRTYARYENQIAGKSEIAASFTQQENFEAAINAYRELVGLDPENALSWNAQIAGLLRRMNRPQEAIALYEEMIASDTKQPERWRWEIGNTHRDAKQYKQAIGVYRQCQNFPENYKQMAACHRALKEYSEAVLLYNQVAGGHEPSAAWAFLQIGYTREAAEQTELAVQAFRNVCRRFPKDQYASVAHAHLQNKYKINETLGGAKDD